MSGRERGEHRRHVVRGQERPALVALRDRIDTSGLFPVLDHVISVNPSPRQFTEGLVVCLEPFLDALYETLMEQLTADPNVFRIPGDERGPAGFMETWIHTLREQTRAGGELDSV
ncbi:hypothetical protein [Streptomyces scabiei]|uniref:hypothetical protein n=1 Tax=Streptomyces scabiei TaxID=1930 RepID=UPI0007658DB4|nr:hypothetical protein [Streptomyces scabiei]